ncbi:Uncharacterised protein [Kluyvera cryocrescens]|uniref:DNA-binding protein n=1 Tax=Kluyvera cryocrescens TaxID=580 RepID=A0A485D5L8_KLUCR|nr:Uncharacterised protein [Kluyvera cryocrescens]
MNRLLNRSLDSVLQHHWSENEQVVRALKQEVEHLKSLVSAQNSHIDSLKQAMQLLEHKQSASDPQKVPAKPWWQFWKG